MRFWLCFSDRPFCLRRMLAVLTLLGAASEATVPARAAEEPATHQSASVSATQRVAGDAKTSEPMYVVDYAVADILARIQNDRHLDAHNARVFLKERVNGPPVLELDAARRRRVRFDELRLVDETLVVAANHAGHEQIAAMLTAFRKFGVVEYVISVRFVTMTQTQVTEAFPDSTSSLLTANQNQRSCSDAVPPESEELPVHRGATAVTARTIIEEGSRMRLRVLDKDATVKLLESVTSDPRSNVLEAPRVTTFLGQTAVLSDLARSRFVVGANLRPSGQHEVTTKEVAEGVSTHFRPVPEPSGDIRLEFATSFTKIEGVTREVLKIAPDKEIALQIPKVATSRVDGGVVLKPGQSLMFGGVKRLAEAQRRVSPIDKLLLGWNSSKEREEVQLIVIVQLESFELPSRATARASSATELAHY